jgi:phosphohistidine swiveling domain-containing protein
MPAMRMQLGTEGDTLHGLAVSPGTAHGRARVVMTLGEAGNVLPGEVLVVREPLFELSPWFAVASAVVAEGGWLLDDAAVLAREYGMPAVFQVERATEKVHDGEELEVDANKGLVIRRPVEQDWEML